MLTSSLPVFGLQDTTERKRMVEKRVIELFIEFMVSKFSIGY